MSRRRTIDREVVAQLGQPVLRRPAAEVAPDRLRSPEFQALVERMLQTLDTAGGVGLAGPQVFAGERVFIATVLPGPKPSDPRKLEVFVNPRLSELSEDGDIRWEGCLSFIELLVRVPRHLKLRIDYLDRHGAAKTLRLEGFPARVVQHEYDHLDGVLTLDRAASPRDVIKASELDDWDGPDDDEDSDDD